MNILDLAGTLSRWAWGQGNGISDILRTTEKELAQNLANNKLLSEFNKSGFKAAEDFKLTSIGKDGKNVEKVIKKGTTVRVNNTDEYNQLVKKGYHLADPQTEKEIEKATNFKNLIDQYNDFQSRGGASLEDSALLGMYNKEKGIGAGNLIGAYFGDEQYGGKRTAAIIGGAGATAIGVRYLSGGNLSTNARGEHDIAGIPFI